MAAKKARKATPLAPMPMDDPMDYHLDALAQKSVLAHPTVVKRMAGVKDRLRKAAQMGLPMDGDMAPTPSPKPPKAVKRPKRAKKGM